MAGELVEAPVWYNNDSLKIAFQQDNPKTAGTKAYASYEQYKTAVTVAAAKHAGATNTDLKNDWNKGFLKIDSSENADMLAEPAAKVKASNVSKVQQSRKHSSTCTGEREEDRSKLQQLALVREVREKLSPHKKKLKFGADGLSEGDMSDGFHELSETDAKKDPPAPNRPRLSLQQFGDMLKEQLGPINTRLESMEHKIDQQKQDMLEHMFDLKANVDS